jgi:hypothetical protein
MHFRDIIGDSIYQKDWVTMIMVQNKYVSRLYKTFYRIIVHFLDSILSSITT